MSNEPFTRPEHEDFPAISAILIQNDQLSETAHLHGLGEADDLFQKITGIDKHVLAYVSVQRGMRAVAMLMRPLAVAAGCWTDGFAAGVQWGRRALNENHVGWAYWNEHSETWHLCKEEPKAHARRKKVFIDG